jgi:hypothetical protein
MGMIEDIEALIARLRDLPEERQSGMAAILTSVLEDEANSTLTDQEITALQRQLASPRRDAPPEDVSSVFGAQQE